MPSISRFDKFFIFVLLAIPCICVVLWRIDPNLTEENQLVEWLEVVVLLLTCMTFAASAWRLPKSGVGFAVCTSLALLILFFAMREIDITEFGRTELHLRIERLLQWAKIGVCVLFLGFCALRTRQVFSVLPALLKTKVVRLSLIGLILLLCSEPFDVNRFHIAKEVSRFIEEMMEFEAYLFLYGAAFASMNWQTDALWPVIRQRKGELKEVEGNQ